VRLVEEAMQPGSSVSFVARRYAISPSLLFIWKRRMLEGGREAVAADEDVVGSHQRLHPDLKPSRRNSSISGDDLAVCSAKPAAVTPIIASSRPAGVHRSTNAEPTHHVD